MEDGNNTDMQKRLGIDINMIGAREETLGKTRSETKELSSPTNESTERADLTMEDWIQETCFISAVTSGPNEPKTFQEAWHSPVKEERENWQKAIRKEIKNMIERGVWRKVDRKNIPNNRRLIGNKWVFKMKRDGTDVTGEGGLEFNKHGSLASARNSRITSTIPVSAEQRRNIQQNHEGHSRIRGNTWLRESFATDYQN